MHPSPESLTTFAHGVLRALHHLLIVICSPLVRLLDAQKMVFALLREMRYGGLTIETSVPDLSAAGKGKEKLSKFGDVRSAEHVKIKVNNRKFYERLIADEDIGFAESYMAGEWETDDLTKVFKLLVKNKLDNKHIGFAIIGRFLNWIWHYLLS
eukprot:33350_6